MTDIVLSDEQAQIVREAQGPVAVRDRNGRFWGYLPQAAFSPEEIEEAKRALDSDQPRYTTPQVLARLRS